MKKFKKLLVLGMMSFLLMTGCTMRMEYGMDIRKDKSMDFNVVVAMDEELLNAMISSENGGDGSETFTDEEQWAYLEEGLKNEEGEDNPEEHGFTSSRYEQDGFKGIKYTKKINNIDDISGDKADFTFEDFAEVSDKIVFTKKGNVYQLDVKYTDSEETSELENYNVGMEINYTMTLPEKPIKHNATKVSEDGKTLTWNLLSSDTKNIQVDFMLRQQPNFVLIGGIVLALLLLIVFFFTRRNTKKNHPTTVTPLNPATNETQDTTKKEM